MRVIAWMSALACCFAVGTAGTALAQPLVTGDLSAYYSFDSDWVDEVPDESSNGVLALNAEVVGNVRRSPIGLGGGSAHFVPGGDPFYNPGAADFFPQHFLDLNGPAVMTTAPGLVPSEAYTVSTWVNLVRYYNLGATPVPDTNPIFCDPACAKDQTQGIWEPRDADGAFVSHFEARADGKMRYRIRGQTNSDNINSVDTVWFNGEPGASPSPPGVIWPNNEWFHYGMTFDKNANAGAGQIKVYINGALVADQAPTVNQNLGDWSAAAEIGRVNDENRQLNGWLDEFYLFTRALSDSEMATLGGQDLGPANVLGDLDWDDDVDFDDIDDFVLGLNNSPLYPSNFGVGPSLTGDMDQDGDLDFDDIAGFVAALAGGGATASSQIVPEPGSLALAGCGLAGLIAAMYRRRRSG